MQIIENGPLGLRSAALQMRSREHKCTFVLFPMLHIGEAQYYDAVAERLAACDHILVEGLKHPLTRTLSRIYDSVAASPRIRLVAQRSMAPKLMSLRDRIQNIDVPAELFCKWWQEQPIWSRLLLPTLARIYFWHLSHFGNRERLARGMEMTLESSRQEILDAGMDFEFTKLLQHRRDEYIVARLDEFHAEHHSKPCTVGIVFGAGHMRALIRHLIDRHSYYVAEASWLTIFGWTQPSTEESGADKRIVEPFASKGSVMPPTVSQQP